MALAAVAAGAISIGSSVSALPDQAGTPQSAAEIQPSEQSFSIVNLSVLGPPGTSAFGSLDGADLRLVDSDGSDVLDSACSTVPESTSDSYDLTCQIDLAGTLQPMLVNVADDQSSVDIECADFSDGESAPIDPVLVVDPALQQLLFCQIDFGPPSVRITTLGVRPGDGLAEATVPVITSSDGIEPECITDNRLDADESSFGQNLIWCFVDVGKSYDVSAVAPPGGYSVRSECLQRLSLFQGNFGSSPPPVVITEQAPFHQCANVLDPPFSIRIVGQFREPADISFLMTDSDGTDVTASCVLIDDSESNDGYTEEVFDCLDLAPGTYDVEVTNVPQIDALDITTNCDEPIVIGQPVPFGEAAPSCSFFAQDLSIPPVLPDESEPEPEPVTPTTEATPDPPTTDLPETGNDMTGQIAFGALLASCGIALTLLGSRRARPL